MKKRLHDDPYEILGLEKFASDEQIKKAYKSLALKLHPDKNLEKDAGEKFKEVRAAYDFLMDPNKKRDYDIDQKYQYFSAETPSYSSSGYFQQDLNEDMKYHQPFVIYWDPFEETNNFWNLPDDLFLFSQQNNNSRGDGHRFRCFDEFIRDNNDVFRSSIPDDHFNGDSSDEEEEVSYNGNKQHTGRDIIEETTNARIPRRHIDEDITKIRRNVDDDTKKSKKIFTKINLKNESIGGRIANGGIKFAQVSCAWCNTKIRESGYLDHLMTCEQRKEMRRKCLMFAPKLPPNSRLNNCPGKLQKGTFLKLPLIRDSKFHLGASDVSRTDAGSWKNSGGERLRGMSKTKDGKMNLNIKK